MSREQAGTVPLLRLRFGRVHAQERRTNPGMPAQPLRRQGDWSRESRRIQQEAINRALERFARAKLRVER